MEAEARLAHNEANVIYERFGEEVVAIHLGTGCYFSLPGVAGDAFVMLSGAPTVLEMAEALSAKYEAPALVIANDLRSFVGQLKEESLIIEVKGATGGSAAALEAASPRLAYLAPSVNSHRDLENLFLVDPVHDAGAEGWPHVKKTFDAGKPVRYRLVPENCLIERFDEAAIALNLHTGAYFSFSGAAEDILLLLHNAPMKSEIVKALATKYVATEAQLGEAVDRFLTRVSEIDLVLAEEVEEDLDIRILVLAKPGQGLPFEAPEIDIFRDSPAVTGESGDAAHDASLFAGRKNFRLNREDNVLAIVSDGAVAVDLVRGNYLIMNATAARVLRMLESAPASSEIVQTLERSYTARRPELVAAVIVLLRNFVGLGLAAADADESAAEPATEPAVDNAREAFEPFSVEMRQDLREQICLYPSGRPAAPEPVARGLQLAGVLEEYFEEASRHAPVTETKIVLAGRQVKIRALGAHAADLTLALSHLRHDFSPGKDAGLTIHVWNGSVAGLPSNALLSSYLQNLYRDWIVCCGSRGELRGFHSPTVPAFYIPGAELLNLVDAGNGKAFFFKKDAAPLPYWEAGSPFRHILHAWLSAQGLQFLHAGAVGINGAGVLLAGRGGSGKSTTTLLCLRAGMAYAGDDYCAVESNASYVHSLYNTAKLLPRDVERFPDWREKVWNPQALLKNSPDKAVFFLADLMPERIGLGFPLKAILAPRIAGGTDTRLTPCGPGAALAAMAPNTVGQLQNAGQPDMDRMATIATELPAYYLDLGSDLTQVADVVRSALG